MKKIIIILVACLALASCVFPSVPGLSPKPLPTTYPQITPIPSGSVPVFDHIFLIILENHNYDEVIGSANMPYLNSLADRYALLTQYHAVRHPSLPNYIALISGDTYGITTDCTDCFIDQVNLADLIEASGRNWKAYQEDMPTPCSINNSGEYVQRHNPFVYFDSIRLNQERCQSHVVPLSQLKEDLDNNQVPDFALLSPNLCHSGHDCSLSEVDQWLQGVVETINQSQVLNSNSLLVITFDEARKSNVESCCGLGQQAGGRVPTLLISSLVRPGFQDDTPLSHYSLLKTILGSWGLPELGFTKDEATHMIEAPWLNPSATRP